MRISDWSSDVCSSDLVIQCRPIDIWRMAARRTRVASPTSSRVCRSPRMIAQRSYRGVRSCLDAARGSARHQRPSRARSEEHTSELQSLMHISYAVFGLKKKKQPTQQTQTLKETQSNHKSTTSRGNN